MKQSILAQLRKQQAKKALLISAEQYFKNWKKEQEVASGHQRLATKTKY